MASMFVNLLVFIVLQCAHTEGIFLVIPEDVPTGLAAIYGFSPRLVKGQLPAVWPPIHQCEPQWNGVIIQSDEIPIPQEIGNDGRFGFGFRLGNVADFQLLYELGPQTVTRPIVSPLRARSSLYRQRLIRQRPFIAVLLRSGLLKEVSYKFRTADDNDLEYDDDPGPR